MLRIEFGVIGPRTVLDRWVLEDHERAGEEKDFSRLLAMISWDGLMYQPDPDKVLYACRGTRRKENHCIATF